MATIKIKYVKQYTAAFTINFELYYVKTGPDFPQLYDRDMRKLLIPNMDHWLQAQTQQRYTLRGLKDMMAAFSDGLEHSYARDDLRAVCEHIYDITRDNIFKTEYTKLYAAAFRVELMDPKQISKLISQINNNFDIYREKFGDDKFHSYLCRIWQICNYNSPNESAVVQGLIFRLGKEPQEPNYPTVDRENDIKSKIITKTLGSDLTKFKGIDENILNNVNYIHSIRCGQ